MRRVLLGQRLTDIAEDLGMHYVTIQRIVSDPLFKSTLHDLQLQRDEKVVRLQEELVEAAISSAKLHRNIVENEEISIDRRQRSATAVLSIVGRLTRPITSSPKEEDLPYEKRFREFIYRESHTSHSAPTPPPQGEHPAEPHPEEGLPPHLLSPSGGGNGVTKSDDIPNAYLVTDADAEDDAMDEEESEDEA